MNLRRINVAVEGRPVTLNPLIHAGKSLATATVTAPIMHSLLQVDYNGRYRGQLATGLPQISEDGLGLIYRIRKDASWHDGTPVTSSDVERTWQLMVDTSTAIPERDGYDRIERIIPINDRAFHIRLNTPYSAVGDLFTSTTGSLIPAHLIRRSNFDATWDETVRPSSGPYRLEEWNSDKIVLRKNPYFRPAPWFDEVCIKFPPTDQERADMIDRRELQFATFNSEKVAREAINSVSASYTLLKGRSSSFECLLFNTRFGSVFEERSTRKSWRAVLDRESIARDAVNAEPLDALLDRPADSEVAQSSSAWGAIPRNRYRGTLDQDEIGWGKEVRLIAIPTPERKRIVKHLRHVAEMHSMCLRVEWLTPEDLTSRLSAQTFDAALVGFTGNPDPAGHYTLWRHCERGGQNYSGINDRSLNAALDKLLNERDERERRIALRLAEEALSETVPAIPLYSYPVVSVLHKGLSGPVPYPYQSGQLVELENWRWAGSNP